MSYGSDYHSHSEYASDRHDHREIDENRYEAERAVRELEERMWEMRRELADYVRIEVEGLHELIRDQSEHSHAPVPAKDGQS